MDEAVESDFSDTVGLVPRITATEASRAFSQLLDRVTAGEQFEITRGGVTVAVITPPRARFRSGAEWRELLESLPPLDASFADDVLEARRSVLPPESHWPS